MLDARDTITVAEATQAVVAALAFAEAGIGISAVEEGGSFLDLGAGVRVHLCETATELLALAQPLTENLPRTERPFCWIYDLCGVCTDPARQEQTNDSRKSRIVS